MVEYLFRSEVGLQIEEAVTAPGNDLHAPALCDVEVTAALRRAMLTGPLKEERAEEAIESYLDLPITRHGHRSLLAPILVLRQNFSAYDATYVALAAQLGAGLLTADRALATSTRAHTRVDLVADRPG